MPLFFDRVGAAICLLETTWANISGTGCGSTELQHTLCGQNRLDQIANETLLEQDTF